MERGKRERVKGKRKGKNGMGDEKTKTWRHLKKENRGNGVEKNGNWEYGSRKREKR